MCFVRHLDCVYITFIIKLIFYNYSVHKSLSLSLLSLGKIPRSAIDESKTFWILLLS